MGDALANVVKALYDGVAGVVKAVVELVRSVFKAFTGGVSKRL